MFDTEKDRGQQRHKPFGLAAGDAQKRGGGSHGAASEPSVPLFLSPLVASSRGVTSNAFVDQVAFP